MTEDQKNSAKFISSKDYMLLRHPKFEGQTRADDNGDYKMYWSVDNAYYYTENNLF